MKVSMRLASVKAKGYRTLGNVDWPISALNVLIGPNGTGKSNMLSFLALIAESAKGNLERSVYSAGGMPALLFDGNGDTIEASLSMAGNEGSSDWLEYGFGMKRLGAGSGYVIAYESEKDWYNRDKTDYAIHRIQREGHVFTADPDKPRIPERVMAAVKEAETSLSHPYLDDGILDVSILTTLQEAVMSWAVYSSVRTDPSSAIRQPGVARRDETLDPDGENLVAVLHTHYSSDLEFRDRIDNAMYAAFGDSYQEISFPPGAEQQVQLAIRWSSLKRPAVAATLSDGTLRFLCIITALSQPNLPALIAIDEPETGLHPTMMRIIAEYAADAALRSQVIFTTHSAAFLDAFDREAPPQTTVVSMVDGKTVLKTVDSAVLARWLKEYSLGNLYRSRDLENMPARGDVQPAGEVSALFCRARNRGLACYPARPIS